MTEELAAEQSLLRAVLDYERASGLSALHYRSLGPDASLADMLDAVRLDLRWWEQHSYEVQRALVLELQRSVYQ